MVSRRCSLFRYFSGWTRVPETLPQGSTPRAQDTMLAVRISSSCGLLKHRLCNLTVLRAFHPVRWILLL